MNKNLKRNDEECVLLTLKERDRRYRLIRSMMRQNNIDVLIVSSNACYPGHVRYFSNYRPHSGYAYVVFPRTGKPTIFVRSAIQQQVAAERWIQDSIYSPNPADAIEKRIKRLSLQNKKIGVVGSENLSFKIYNHLVKVFNANEFIDATKKIIDIRMIKSQEELAIARRCAVLTDRLFDHVKTITQAGMKEIDVYAEIEFFMRKNSIENSFNLITSGLFPIAPYVVPTGRMLHKKDTLLLELTPQYQGFYTQLTLPHPITKFSRKMKKFIEIALAAQAAGLEKLKPGNTASSVEAEMKKVIKKAGYHMPYRGGHSLGHEHAEPPVLTMGDETVLEPGMTLVVHPSVTNKDNEGVFLGDTYIVTETGWERIHNSLDVYKR
ncbi:MAG: Xaa-Pro peptidase family protein [Thermodesulfobacteriota bacterium]